MTDWLTVYGDDESDTIHPINITNLISPINSCRSIFKGGGLM